MILRILHSLYGAYNELIYKVLLLNRLRYYNRTPGGLLISNLPMVTIMCTNIFHFDSSGLTSPLDHHDEAIRCFSSGIYIRLLFQRMSPTLSVKGLTDSALILKLQCRHEYRTRF